MFCGQPTLEAFLTGHCAGRSVDFIKIYSDNSAGYQDAVDYVGQLSAEGEAVTGVWSLLDMDGTFEMFRDQAIEEPVSAAVTEEIIEDLKV